MVVRVYGSDGTSFSDVALDGITEDQYQIVSDALIEALTRERQLYIGVAQAMHTAITICPEANPADLWVHLIYHEFRNRAGRSDQSWKRVSGQASEHLVLLSYQPRLSPYGVILRVSSPSDAVALNLVSTGIGGSKTDLILEGMEEVTTRRFGVIHCKVSIAERLSDDAPASRALIDRGYWSSVVTMDAKMYPPPHGDAVVRGELGFTKQGTKRNYFEVAGQFSACYSFNRRTPPSVAETPSGSRIYSLSLSDGQPDLVVRDILATWNTFQANP